jgi:HAD superfamily hydrolase (TIGR01490 family)
MGWSDRLQEGWFIWSWANLHMMTEAAFFDLDKTIIAKSSTLAFTKPLFKAGLLNHRTMAKAGIAQAYYQVFGADHSQLERVKTELANITSGWDRDELVALIEETVDGIVPPLVFAEALAIIERHRGLGRRIIVVSSSPEEIVKPLCRYLSIDDVIATRTVVGSDGKYTGEIEFYAYGPGKAEAMTELADHDGVDLDASYAYSDSATDLPMLELVGHPVAVNPDSDLARIANERGWEIRRFESPVSIRDRINDNKVSGAAVASGVAALVTYWALKGRRKS